LGVSDTTLFVSPINNKFKASSSDAALCTDKPDKIISSFYVSLGITFGKSLKFFVE
jgi:hypothetical protein